MRKSLLLAAAGSSAYFYYRARQTEKEVFPVDKLDENVFVKRHNFLSYGIIPLTSRMTIIRNNTNELMLYNPVPINKEELKNLGHVQYVIVGNKQHVKFLTYVHDAFILTSD
jgi:hypothetical protein